jgi:hypothetical protein
LMFQHELLPNPYLFFIGKLNIADWCQGDMIYTRQ